MEELQKLQALISRHREIKEELSKTKDKKIKAKLNRELKKVTEQLYGATPTPLPGEQSPAGSATAKNPLPGGQKKKKAQTGEQSKPLPGGQFTLIKDAGGVLRNYRITGLPNSESYRDCVLAAEDKIRALLGDRFKESQFKFSIVIHCGMIKPVHTAKTSLYDEDASSSDFIDQTAYFRSTVKTILSVDDIRKKVNAALDQCDAQLDEYTSGGSGWIVNKVHNIDVEIADYKPFTGKSYIPTPDFVPVRSVVNVRNDDNRCFMYAVLASIYPPTDPIDKTHVTRPGIYKEHFDKINLDGITYPVDESYYAKFEANNPTLSLNVFGIDRSMFYPIYVSDEIGRTHVDLLIIQDLPADNQEDQPSPQGINQHYVCIRDLGTMLCRLTKYKGKRFPCRRCLHIFSSQDTLDRHVPDCRGISKAAQRVVMPSKSEIIKYNEYHKQLRAPFVIYADFECLNIPCQEGNGQLTAQEPCSFYYVVVRSDGQTRESEIYVGEDAAVVLLRKLFEEVERINETLRDPMPMIDPPALTGEEQVCCICNKLIEVELSRHKMSYLKIVRRTDYGSQIWSGTKFGCHIWSYRTECGCHIRSHHAILCPPEDQMSHPYSVR